MKVVIIGHGSSGWTTATTLRAWDRKCEITVIDPKHYDAYHPCAMPYAIGGLLEDETPLKESMNYERMNINFLRRHKAMKIDRENKNVSVKNLENEELSEVEYDKLVICTGSIAKYPPIPGADGKNIYALKWIERRKPYLKPSVYDRYKLNLAKHITGFIHLYAVEDFKYFNQQRIFKVFICFG